MEEFDLVFIKQRRIQLEKSLQNLAESLGMKNASTYMKYENGTYSFKAEHLPVLAKALDCNVADFFKISVAEIAM